MTVPRQPAGSAAARTEFFSESLSRNARAAHVFK
jgi:hypothetical protein